MEEQDLLTPQEFAAKIKAKYPQYTDVEDSVLVEKMIAKYPEYKSKINFETVQPEAQEIPEVPKGEVAEVDGESVSTSASTASLSDSKEPKETPKYRIPTEDELAQAYEDSFVEIEGGVKIPKGNVIDLDKERARSRETLTDITDDLDKKQQLSEYADVAKLVGVDVPEDRVLRFRRLNQDMGVENQPDYAEMVKGEITQKVADAPLSSETFEDPYKNYPQYRDNNYTEIEVYNIFNAESGELDGIEDPQDFADFLVKTGAAAKYDREIAPHYDRGDYLYSAGDTQVQAYKHKLLTDYWNTKRLRGARDYEILAARGDVKGEDNNEQMQEIREKLNSDTKQMLGQIDKFIDLKQRFEENIKKEREWEEYLRGDDLNIGMELEYYGSSAWNSVSKILLGTVGSTLDMIGDIAENPMGAPDSTVEKDYNIFHSSAAATDTIFDMVSVDMPNLQKTYLSYKPVNYKGQNFQVDTDTDAIYQDGILVRDLDEATQKEIVKQSRGVEETESTISVRATTTGTMNMITQLYMMVKTAKALPIKNYSASAGFAGVLQTHHDNYVSAKAELEEGIASGQLDMPIEDVDGLAKMNAYLNDVVIFSAGALSPNRPLANISSPIQLAKELYKKDLSTTIGKRLSTYGGNVLKESLKELVQEETELVVSKNINALTNILAGETLMDTELRKSEVAETALVTLLGTGISTGVMQRGQLFNENPSLQLYKNAVKLSKIDTPTIQKAMDRAVKSGDLNQSQVDALNKTLLNIAKFDGKIPKDIESDEVRQALLPLLQKREELKQAEANSDPAFKEKFKSEQEKLTEKIKSIVNGKSTNDGSGQNLSQEAQAETDTTAEDKKASYIEELKETKKSDPEQYWSVDSVSPDAQGQVVEVEDGKAFVKEDGDIVGVFKKAGSELKRVADNILQKAVKMGGNKLDNFDNYLTKIYKRNGFRVVGRMKFNEEYAPEGWNKEKHGTPDVIAMVYDPNNEMDIDEQTFEDYDEMIAYRDSYLEEKESSINEIEKIDLSESLGIKKVESIIDNLDKQLKDFGDQTLGLNMPVAVARVALKGMKGAVAGTRLTADLVSAGLNAVMETSWYKNLTKKQKDDFHKKGLMSYLGEMETTLRKGKQPTTKANKDFRNKVKEVTGQTDTSKKITISEKRLNKKMMQLAEREGKTGERVGRKEIMEAKKEAITKINEAVKPLIKKHKDNTLYAKAYAKALSAVNQYNGKNINKVNEAIDKIEAIIEKEALAKSLRKNRRKAKASVKRLGKTADPIRRLLRYKPEWLNESEIKELDEVLGMFSTKWTEDYNRSKVEALEEKLKANYLENIGERIESTKEDSDNFNELDDIAGKMNKLTYTANKANLSQVERETVRDFSRIEPEYFDGLTPAKLREINKALTALVEDGILVNNVLFDHVSRNDAQVSSKELKGKLGTQTLKTKNNFLDSVKQVFKDRKSETIEDVVSKVRKRMLQHIDTVITNFKGNYLYTNIIHPFSSSLEMASNQTSTTSVQLDKLLAKAKKSREGSRLSRLKNEMKRGAKLDGALATSYEYRLQAMLQFYFREKEFRANPEYKNSKVFSISDHMKNLNTNPQQTNMTEASVKEVNRIYDKYKDSQGNIDLDKLEKSFTKEEKALIDFMESKLKESEDKARFTADHIRGESQTFLNNYFPRKSSKVDTKDGADVLSMKDSGGGLSVKASAANARAAKKGEALDFSTLNTFLAHIGAVNIDYHMSPQLKKMRLLASEMGTGTQEQAKLGQVLLKVTNDMVKAQVTNVNDPVNSLNEKFFNILKRKTFNKVLIDPVKLIGWDIPSTWIPIALANAYRTGRVRKANKNIDGGLRKKIMKEIGSVQVERIGSRSADIKATSSSSISKSKFKKVDPSRRENLMDFINKNQISDLADTASTYYYKTVDMMMGNLWSTEMFESFQRLTGQELNSKNYELMKEEFPKEMKQAVAKADKETSNLFNTATTAEQKLDVQFASSTSWKKIVDTFMKSFAFNENSVMWDSLKSMVGKGNMTREEAVRTFAIVNARGLAYAYLSQIIMGYVLNPSSDDEEDFDEISQRAMERSMWQHGMLYAFGNRGNVFNMAAAYLIESGREVAFKSEGEKYNQYEDANLFALPKRGSMSQYVGALGAEGELLKVGIQGAEIALKIATKYAEGEEVTSEDLIEWKAAGYSLSLLSQLTGLSTYRLGKILDKELKANQ